MEFLPHGRYGKTDSRGMRARAGSQRGWGRLAVLAAATAAAGLILPSGIGSAEPAAPARHAGAPPGLHATVAAADKLSSEIDSLGQQYDSLRIQLTLARSESQQAAEAAQRDQQALGAGQAAVAQIAAEGYMTGSLNPTIELLQSPDPQQFLNRASIMLQLAHEQGGTVSLLSEAETAANRARQTASQEAAQAARLAAAMSQKVSQIQAEEKVLNSSAYSQALAIFDKTGSFPDIAVTGDSLGEQALRAAMSQTGKPYVWGGAGPTGFDCSGLVMWAYAQVGISLDHFTGDQWNEGQHISRSQLQPGDLVFFFADISHVGMYIGNGLMVAAPTFGQDVQVQPVFWDAYVGAVRIVA